MQGTLPRVFRTLRARPLVCREGGMGESARRSPQLSRVMAPSYSASSAAKPVHRRDAVLRPGLSPAAAAGTPPSRRTRSQACGGA